MTVPAGAYAVDYMITVYEESPSIDVDTSFQVLLSSDDRYTDIDDAAAQAAAEAMVDSLRAAYPGVTVHRNRQYLIRQPDPTWTP